MIKGDDGDGRIDTWAEIEDAIERKVERRLASEMIDVNLAAVRAREFAADAVRVICSALGGDAHYIPKVPHHHREARNTQIRMLFNVELTAGKSSGDVCRETAADADLSPRHIRNIVYVKKS